MYIYIYILTKVVFNCSYLGYRAGKKNLLYITKKYLFFNYTLKFCCFYFYFILYIYIYYIYIYIYLYLYIRHANSPDYRGRLLLWKL